MASRFNTADAIVTPPAWFVYAALVGAHAAFNLILSPVGLPVGAQASAPVWVDAMIGAMSVQPFLLGTWAGVGPGKFLTRLPIVLAAQILLLFAGSFKQWNVLAASWNLPPVAATGTGVIQLGDLLAGLSLFAIICAIARVAGRMTERKISRVPFQPTVGESRRQFTIKYLLGMTAVCAILLALARQIAFELPPRTRWLEIVFPALIAPLGGLFFLPSVVLSSLVLSQRICTRRHAGYLAEACAVSLLTMIAMCLMVSQPISTFARQLLPAQAGAVAAGVLSAWPLRLAGYRFVRLAAGHVYGANYLSEQLL